MRIRTPTREQSRSRTEPAADSASDSGLVKHLLTAVGILAVAYIVSRVLDSVEEITAQRVDDIQEEILKPAPDDLVRSVPGIRSRGADTETSSEAEESDTDALDETKTNADYTDEPRSDAEIAERAASNVQDEPAEPGEMAVDEDVAEELVEETDSEAESEGESDGATDTEE